MNKPTLLASFVGLGLLLLAALSHFSASGGSPAIDTTIVTALGYGLAIAGIVCVVALLTNTPQTEPRPQDALFRGLERLASGDHDAAIPLPDNAGDSAQRAIAALRSLVNDKSSASTHDGSKSLNGTGLNGADMAALKEALRRSRQLEADGENFSTLSGDSKVATAQFDTAMTQSSSSVDRLKEQTANLTEQIERLRQSIRQLQDTRLGLEVTLPALQDLVERSNVLSLNVTLQSRKGSNDENLAEQLSSELTSLAKDTRDVSAEFQALIGKLDATTDNQNSLISDASKDLKIATQTRSDLEAALNSLATLTSQLRNKLEQSAAAGARQQRGAAELIRDLARLAESLSNSSAPASDHNREESEQ